MSKNQEPPLALAVGYHLRAQPLWDGRVGVEGFDLKATYFKNDGERHEQFLGGKFDAAEFSLALYILLKSRGEPLEAIPVFPNRKFRHAYIFVREDSPLSDPRELKGKKVGIPSWLNTCGLWVRGILHDEYGVKNEDIQWQAMRSEVPLNPPSGTQIERVSGNAKLPARLLSGELDAIIVPDFPEESGIRRLFHDSKKVEQESYRRTQIFPTSHAVVIRRSYLDKNPDVAPALFRAWCEARNLALQDDEDATFSNFAWVRQAWEEQRAVMGSNPWRFGIKGNEKTLEAQIRYAGEQGLLARKIGIEDLYIRMDEV